jgi:hypothetical protein
VYADVASGTSVAVTELPGNLAGDPAEPPDSAFYRFGGSCSGSGACIFTPDDNTSAVHVYFIPATAKLTLKPSPGTDEVDMTAEGAGTPITGSDPASPVYFGGDQDMALPCTLLLRLDNTGKVFAIALPSSGYELSPTNPFISNRASYAGSDGNSCQVVMTGDQVVAAYSSKVLWRPRLGRSKPGRIPRRPALPGPRAHLRLSALVRHLDGARKPPWQPR